MWTSIGFLLGLPRCPQTAPSIGRGSCFPWVFGTFPRLPKLISKTGSPMLGDLWIHSNDFCIWGSLYMKCEALAAATSGLPGCRVWIPGILILHPPPRRPAWKAHHNYTINDRKTTTGAPKKPSTRFLLG